MIHSAARMTYTDVQAVLDGDGGARRRYRKMAGRFELMKELALVLNAKRERRGSIDFDLPEPEIEFDEQGRMVGITRSERLMAHRIIEEFMLAPMKPWPGIFPSPQWVCCIASTNSRRRRRCLSSKRSLQLSVTHWHRFAGSPTPRCGTTLRA